MCFRYIRFVQQDGGAVEYVKNSNGYGKILELAVIEEIEVNWDNEAEAFKNGFDKLLQILYNNSNKSKNVRIPTIYDLMMKKGLKKRKISDI